MDGNATVDKAIEKKLSSVAVDLVPLEQRANNIDELYSDAEKNREEFKRVVSRLGEGHIKSLKPRNQVTDYKTETGVLRAEIIGSVDEIINSVELVEIKPHKLGSTLIVNVGNHLAEIDVKTPEQKAQSDQEKLSAIHKKANESGFSAESEQDIKAVEEMLDGSARKEFHKTVRENEIKHPREIKVTPRPEPKAMPIWTKTLSQLSEEKQTQKREVDIKRESIDLSTLRSRINETYKDKEWSSSAVEGVTALINARAKVMDMTSDEWIEEYLNPETLQELEAGNFNGYTQFLEDGKAIIKVTEISDISTLFHELGHVIRRQLSPKEIDIVKKNLVIDEFDKAGEEKFAEAFEQYLQIGASYDKELSKIFDKIKEFLKSIYSALLNSDLSNENIKKVFDRLLSEPEYNSHLVKTKDKELILFQKNKSIDKLIDKYKDKADLSIRFNEKQNLITIDKIIVKEKRNGTGSKILNDLIEIADNINTVISLDPTSDFGTNKSILTKFYKKMGFVENSGKNKNYEIYESMYRDRLYQKRKHYLDPEAVEKHRVAIQQAIENYYPVTREVVEDYKGEEWADKYLELFDFMNDFTEVIEQARFADSFDNFLEISEVSATDKQSKSWMLDQVYHRAQVKTLGEGNEHFRELLSDDQVFDQMLSDMHKDYYLIRDFDFNPTVKKATKRARYGNLSPDLREQARKIITGNSIVKYRKVYSTIGGMQDLEELRAIDLQETYSNVDRKPIAYEDLSSYKRGQFIASFTDYKQQRKYLEGGFNGKELQGLLETVNKNVVKLEDEVQEVKTKARQVVDNLNRKIRNYAKDINNLTEKTQSDKERLIKDFELKISEQKKEATIKKNEALKKLKDDIRRSEAQKRAIRNERKRGLQLAKYITKAPTSYIAFEYQERVKALQDALNIDPRYRSKKTIDKMLENLGKIDYEAFLHSTGTVGNKFIQRLKDNIKEGHSTPLNFFTISELEDLYNYVKLLKKEGRLAKERDDDIRRQKLRQSIQRIKKDMLGKKSFDGIRHYGSKETQKSMESSIFTKERLTTLTPSRVLQYLSDGQKGELYKVFHDDLNNALNKSIDQKFKREKSGENELKRLGIKKKDLGKSITIEFDGQNVSYSIDEIIHMNIALKNEQSRNALIFGNFVGTDRSNEAKLVELEHKALDQIQKFIDKLDQKYIEWGDYLLKDFDDNYHRLREAFILDKNEDLGHVDNYFTIVRADSKRDDGKTLHEVLKEESRIRTKYANKDMTKSRIEIANHHQSPIKLGATSIWTNQVEKQEHYISHYQVLKDMNYLVKEIDDVVMATHGRSAVKWLNKFIEDISNPQMFKNHDDITSFQTFLRNNMAVSYLAFNVMTIAKQIPSFLYFSHNTNPVDMMSTAVDFMKHPIKTMEFVNDNSPQMRVRAVNRFTEEMKQHDKRAGARAVRKVGQVGMMGIMAIDKMVTAQGWLSIYKTQYRQLSKLMSHEKAHTEACKEADTTIMNTQPSARAKDLPALYRSESAVKWFLMFSNQLNKIYNITTYDIPQAFKSKQFNKGIAQTMGVLMGMATMSALGGFRLPDDSEEIPEAVFKEYLKNFATLIPLAGKPIAEGLDGFYGSGGGVEILPVAGEIGRALNTAMDLTEEYDEEKMQKMIKGLASQSSVFAGIPYTAGNRVYKAIDNEDLLELLGSNFAKGDK